MFLHLPPFLLHWLLTAVSLWLSSHVFRGIKFSDTASLLIAALVLGLVNALLKPVLILLTLPLTLLTLGFFLLVLNALMILLVSALVRGFTVSGFWTAFFASVFISLLNGIIEWLFTSSEVTLNSPLVPNSGRWI